MIYLGLVLYLMGIFIGVCVFHFKNVKSGGEYLSRDTHKPIDLTMNGVAIAFWPTLPIVYWAIVVALLVLGSLTLLHRAAKAIANDLLSSKKDKVAAEVLNDISQGPKP